MNINDLFGLHGLAEIVVEGSFPQFNVIELAVVLCTIGACINSSKIKHIKIVNRFPEDEANNFHPSIKFTAEISTKQHVFLDTKSNLMGDTISVDLYTKPTDTHQYFLPTSCHPKHCCKNVPYSLALRLRRICSDSETFESRARELTDHLCKRGYQKQEISLAIVEHGNKKKKTYFLIGLNPS